MTAVLTWLAGAKPQLPGFQGFSGCLRLSKQQQRAQSMWMQTLCQWREQGAGPHERYLLAWPQRPGGQRTGNFMPPDQHSLQRNTVGRVGKDQRRRVTISGATQWGPQGSATGVSLPSGSSQSDQEHRAPPLEPAGLTSYSSCPTANVLDQIYCVKTPSLPAAGPAVPRAGKTVTGFSPGQRVP